MEELIAVIDESGRDKDPLEHICVIVGDYSTINNNITKLPPTFTHMTNLPEKEKLPLLRKFDFSGNIYVCCMYVSLKQLRDKIDERIVKKRSNKIKRNINRIVGIEIRSRIHTAIWDFLLKNKYETDKLVFQIDNDILREYLKESGLKTKHHTSAHKLADCVAHANYKGWDLKDFHVNEFANTFRNDFHEIVMSQIKKVIK